MEDRQSENGSSGGAGAENHGGGYLGPEYSSVGKTKPAGRALRKSAVRAGVFPGGL